MRKNYDTPSLPEHCYAVLPNSGQLIEVRRGEMGYYPCAYSTGGRAYNQVLENYFNAHEGISKAQAAAMLAGSMFGWSVPAADPSRYDLDGEPVRPGVRKALPRSPQYLYEQAKLLREEYAPGTKVILDEAVNTPTMMHPQGWPVSFSLWTTPDRSFAAGKTGFLSASFPEQTISTRKLHRNWNGLMKKNPIWNCEVMVYAKKRRRVS
ncbi:Uncharacterised protein [Flavonifractor plautii]|nr:Uncharacterised protein [Flavonifractor plautii]